MRSMRTWVPTGRIEHPTPSEAWRAWITATAEDRERAAEVFADACRRASR